MRYLWPTLYLSSKYCNTWLHNQTLKAFSILPCKELRTLLIIFLDISNVTSNIFITNYVVFPAQNEVKQNLIQIENRVGPEYYYTSTIMV